MKPNEMHDLEEVQPYSFIIEITCELRSSESVTLENDAVFVLENPYSGLQELPVRIIHQQSDLIAIKVDFSIFDCMSELFVEQLERCYMFFDLNKLKISHPAKIHFLTLKVFNGCVSEPHIILEIPS